MATILDPDAETFGTDVAKFGGDVKPVWGIVSGRTNYAQALLRRFNTVHGSIPYFPSYGRYLPGLISAKWDKAIESRARGWIIEQCKQDPRTKDASVDFTFVFATKTLIIRLSLLTADGPFSLVLVATSVSVALLAVDGITITAEQNAAALANIIVVKGDKGDQGVQGPAGGGGGGGGADAELDFGDNVQSSSSGSEEIAFEDTVRFGDLPAGSLTAAISAQILSSSGTGTFRVRVGGSAGVADGTIALTITTTSTTFTVVTSTAAFTNPTGTLRVKVTAQSSAAGPNADIKACVVTFR